MRTPNKDQLEQSALNHTASSRPMHHWSALLCRPVAQPMLVICLGHSTNISCPVANIKHSRALKLLAPPTDMCLAANSVGAATGHSARCIEAIFFHADHNHTEGPQQSFPLPLPPPCKAPSPRHTHKRHPQPPLQISAVITARQLTPLATPHWRHYCPTRCIPAMYTNGSLAHAIGLAHNISVARAADLA